MYDVRRWKMKFKWISGGKTGYDLEHCRTGREQRSWSDGLMVTWLKHQWCVYIYIYVYIYILYMTYHTKSTLTDEITWACPEPPSPSSPSGDEPKADMIGIPMEEKLDEVVPSKDPKDLDEPVKDVKEKTLPKAPEPNNKEALTEEGMGREEGMEVWELDWGLGREVCFFDMKGVGRFVFWLRGHKLWTSARTPNVRQVCRG